MGFYIETGSSTGKAKFIVDNYSGKEDSFVEAIRISETHNREKGVIIVVNNGPFEAAAFAFNHNEFLAFHNSDDNRPKQYVIMDYNKACELTGYKK